MVLAIVAVANAGDLLSISLPLGALVLGLLAWLYNIASHSGRPTNTDKGSSAGRFLQACGGSAIWLLR
ncbi:hypothetical protein [Pseudomonas sp.]|uniref:hypothetical protein n=1 Tax=Pseudomonas sp. TaxID=306 RepID=UPI00299EE61A|nr:hypothetical protein [Pseudomonas sp.]MDX1370394.1 hypothetical protein [Pseudomonas sp.]